jgi:hypothetical protein
MGLILPVAVPAVLLVAPIVHRDVQTQASAIRIAKGIQLTGSTPKAVEQVAGDLVVPFADRFIQECQAVRRDDVQKLGSILRSLLTQKLHGLFDVFVSRAKTDVELLRGL